MKLFINSFVILMFAFGASKTAQAESDPIFLSQGGTLNSEISTDCQKQDASGYFLSDFDVDSDETNLSLLESDESSDEDLIEKEDSVVNEDQ